MLITGAVATLWVKSSPRHLWTYSAFWNFSVTRSIAQCNQHPSDNQPFDCMTFAWEVLTKHGNGLRLFWAKAFPQLKLFMSRIWHSSSRNHFNVFSYDTVLERDSNLSPSRRRSDALRVESRSHFHCSLCCKNSMKLFKINLIKYVMWTGQILTIVHIGQVWTGNFHFSHLEQGSRKDG